MTTLTLGTWNAGPGTIADGLEVAGAVDALAMQESSDQDRMMARFHEKGYGVIRPPDMMPKASRNGRIPRFDSTVGMHATPLIFDPQALLLISPIVVRLSHGGNIGPGTGPDDGKPKWLIGGHFIHLETRRRIAVTSMHNYPGQKPGNRREELSTEMVTTARDAFDRYTGIPFILGDFNTLPTKRVLYPLHKHHWLCDQLVGQRLPTHGPSWSPDHCWWRKDERVHFVKHRTIRNSSDHDALVVTLNLTHRGR